MEKELRIGNWINDHEGIPRQVAYYGQTIGLDIGDGATQKYQHNPIISGDINTLAPIPLDEDWLLDFGFKKVEIKTRSGIGWLWNKKRIVIDSCMGAFVVRFRISKNHSVPIKTISSIHKLQNIFYEFEDEELIRKQNVKNFKI